MPTATATGRQAATAAPVKRGARGLRFADRYFGIPLLAAAGALKRRRALPATISRIGVLNSTNMGDTVILSPVLRDIAAAYPDAEVLLFAGGANASLAPLLPAVRPVPIALANPRSAVHDDPLAAPRRALGLRLLAADRARLLHRLRSALHGRLPRHQPAPPLRLRCRRRAPAKNPRARQLPLARQRAVRDLDVAAADRAAGPAVRRRAAAASLRRLPHVAGRLPQRAQALVARLLAAAGPGGGGARP